MMGNSDGDGDGDAEDDDDDEDDEDDDDGTMWEFPLLWDYDRFPEWKISICWLISMSQEKFRKSISSYQQ